MEHRELVKRSTLVFSCGDKSGPWLRNNRRTAQSRDIANQGAEMEEVFCLEMDGLLSIGTVNLTLSRATWGHSTVHNFHFEIKAFPPAIVMSEKSLRRNRRMQGCLSWNGSVITQEFDVFAGWRGARHESTDLLQGVVSWHATIELNFCRYRPSRFLRLLLDYGVFT